MRKIPLLFIFLGCAGFLMAQSRTITGTVTDVSSGEALVGCTVVAKGTRAGTVTDLNGKYTLSVPSDANVLIYSFTGYKTEETTLGNSNIVDQTMTENTSILTETVVVGYGTQIKSTVTGNIVRVKGDVIAAAPVTTIEQGLQGRAAGVFIEANNGKPGGAIKVRIRGSSSITASNQPLYVIDGVPVNTDAQNDPNDADLNPLADINFNDIESLDVLKDASAAAIYGSRGANGVVIITTKKGKAGKSTVNFNVQTGVSRPTRLREFLNAEEFISFFRDAAIGSGRYDFANGVSGYASEQEAIDDNIAFVNGRLKRYSDQKLVADANGMITIPAGYETNDWQNLAFRNAVSRQSDLSFSGGTERLRYFASGGWSDQEGILVNNGLQRLSGRLNMDAKVTNRFDLGVTMVLSRLVNNNAPDDNAFSTPMQMVALAPITPLRNADGEYYDRPVTTYYNPLIETEYVQRKATSFRNLTNFYGDYKIVDGLSLRGEFGVDLTNFNQQRYWGSRSEVGLPVGGSASARWSNVTNYDTKLLLNYFKNTNSGHNFTATGGMEYQNLRQENTQVDAEGFPLDELKTLASAATVTLGTGNLTEYSFLSYIGRATYDYNRKYLLTLTGRADGSSRFGKNNQFGFFPSVSAGWVLTEEDLLANNKALSFLKIRASYGITGNAGIGNFDHLGLYNGASYSGQSGLQPTQIPNPNLSWEKTGQADIGIDFGFLDNRISGELDFYSKQTTDLLLDVPVPGTTGFTTQTQNIGKMSNKGIELAIVTDNLANRQFTWRTSLNFARNINEVVALAEGQEIIDNGGSRFMNVVKEGESLGSFLGAQYAGVDPANGDALWYVNGDDGARTTTNDFNNANFVVLGSPNPDWITGITNDFGFKGLTLGVTFNAVYGNEVHDAAGGFMSCNGCWFDNQTRDQLKSWKQPGDVTDVPEARLGFSNGDQSRSSRYLYDGSYIRLKNISLGYELPKSVVGKARFSKVRFYVTGQNLWTGTKYKGWDPEVSTDFAFDNVTSGVDFYAAPQPKTVVFGINLGF